MERLVVLRFSTGCSSQTSVAVGKSSPRKPKSESSPNIRSKQVVGEECSSEGRTKNSFGWLPLPKPSISGGIHRFVRTTVKSLSQLFVYKEMEKVTAEMEIGFPTHVKHVTHVGPDGISTNNPVKGGWEDFNPPIITAFPSISVGKFELAMAPRTQNGPPLVV